jgi:hypothetical protein
MKLFLLEKYLHQKKKHQASLARLLSRQRIHKKRSINAFILTSDRVSKELIMSCKSLRESRGCVIEMNIHNR